MQLSFGDAVPRRLKPILSPPDTEAVAMLQGTGYRLEGEQDRSWARVAEAIGV